MSVYELTNFKKYDTIFKEGAKGDAAYLVKEGVVELSKMVAGEKKVLARLTPISVFGEMALILPDNQRTATAMALEDLKVIRIRQKDFDAVVAESPQILQAFLNVLVHRLKTYTTRATHITSITHGLALLFDLLAKHGVEEADQYAVADTLSRFFLFPEKNAHKFIKDLEAVDLVEIDDREGGAKVRILEKDNFAGTAVRMLRASKEPLDDDDDDDD